MLSFKKNAVAGYVNGGFAIIFLIIAGVSYWQTTKFIKSSIKTEGVIIELVDKSKNNRAHPRISYVDSEMHVHTFRSPSSNNTWSVGQHVSVYYKKDNPSQARLDSFIFLWLGTLIFGIFGVLQMIISLVFLLLGGVIRRPRRTVVL